ncbi:unnamed protein product [Moneuplotes crassus]|uniref:DNA replication factor Dna2 N-terminal domain-containing protein n=1 Tax=Euplotes crassus TaxID=5936 RepID=A0AAD1XVN1_EUPCR|nr:unnamed protein product [Moneuplotes crassus]
MGKRDKKEEEKRLEVVEETKEKVVYQEEYKNECFVIEKVEEEEHPTPSKNKKIRVNQVKILTLRLLDQEKSKREFILILTDFWFFTRAHPQHQVQVIGSFNDVNNFQLTLRSSRIIQEENAEFIILEPKIMISCTQLTENYAKAHNKDKTLRMDKKAYKNPAIYGKIIHLLFSDLIGTRANDKAIFDKFIHQAIEKHCLELYSYKMQSQDDFQKLNKSQIRKHVYEEMQEDEECIIKKLNDVIQATLDWKKIFEERYFKYNKYKLKLMGQIGSEQEIYSTKFGLKGKIDSICEFEDYAKRKVVYAVELKTGVHQKNTYQNQVLLYSLLLRETFSNAAVNNMLVYLHDVQNTQLIYWSHRNLSKIIQHRNKMVSKIVHPARSIDTEEKKSPKRKQKELEVQELTNLYRRVVVFDTGYSLLHCKPVKEGFTLTLCKDVTQEVKSSEFKPILPLKSEVTIRPMGSEIVFSMGVLEKVNYSITNLETEVTKKTKISYKIPKLEEEDSCEVRYIIKYEEHPYMNSKVVNMENSSVIKDSEEWQYQFEKEYYTQEDKDKEVNL